MLHSEQATSLQEAFYHIIPDIALLGSILHPSIPSGILWGHFTFMKLLCCTRYRMELLYWQLQGNVIIWRG